MKKTNKKKIAKKKTTKKQQKNISNINTFKQELLKIKNEILSTLEKTQTIDTTKDIGDEIDDVTQTIEKEMIFDLSSNDKNILSDIEVALKKIEMKKYGICELCKEKIEEKRLKAIPYTRYCLKCQIKQTK